MVAIIKTYPVFREMIYTVPNWDMQIASLLWRNHSALRYPINLCSEGLLQIIKKVNSHLMNNSAIRRNLRFFLLPYDGIESKRDAKKQIWSQHIFKLLILKGNVPLELYIILVHAYKVLKPNCIDLKRIPYIFNMFIHLTWIFSIILKGTIVLYTHIDVYKLFLFTYRLCSAMYNQYNCLL